MSADVRSELVNRIDALKQKPLSRFVWWMLFLVGTYVMSLCFERFRVFTLTPTVQNGAWLFFVLLMMFHVLFVMVYDSYVQEKISGRIQKPFQLFEWLIQKRFLLKHLTNARGN
jgi:hypothetical protein